MMKEDICCIDGTLSVNSPLEWAVLAIDQSSLLSHVMFTSEYPVNLILSWTFPRGFVSCIG